MLRAGSSNASPNHFQSQHGSAFPRIGLIGKSTLANDWKAKYRLMYVKLSPFTHALKYTSHTAQLHNPSRVVRCKPKSTLFSTEVSRTSSNRSRLADFLSVIRHSTALGKSLSCRKNSYISSYRCDAHTDRLYQKRIIGLMYQFWPL